MTDYDRRDIPGMPLCKEHKQWHQCATSKIFQCVFQMVSLCCLVSSVVDHMLLVSDGVIMVVHIFWGYSLVILCSFFHGGNCLWFILFCLSVAFLLFFCFFVVYIQDIISPLDVV